MFKLTFLSIKPKGKKLKDKIKTYINDFLFQKISMKNKFLYKRFFSISIDKTLEKV